MPGNDEAFRSFRMERDAAIRANAKSFVFSGNGKTYKRVDDGSEIIKYKASGKGCTYSRDPKTRKCRSKSQHDSKVKQLQRKVQKRAKSKIRSAVRAKRDENRYIPFQM